MHDLLTPAAILSARLLADGSGTLGVQTALIGAVALVLAALVPAVLGRREREPKSIRDLRAAEKKLRDELEEDRDEWRNRFDSAVKGIDLRDAEIDRLRRLCIAHHLNPYPEVGQPLPPPEYI